MNKLPSSLWKNLGWSVLICTITISLITAFVFKMLDSRTASYFFYGACTMIAGVLGAMQLFSVNAKKDAYNNVFFLSLMILNLFFLHGLFNGKIWFLVLFPLLIGTLMLAKLRKDVKHSINDAAENNNK
jgi:membrane associated rhomboid family serine protease